MEEQKEEGNNFSKLEKRRSVTPEFVVKLDTAMRMTVGGAQALHTENDVLPVVIKGDEPAPGE